jgi:CBS domain-containing protein
MATVEKLLKQKGDGVITMGCGASVLEAAMLMNDHHIGGVVVVDEGKPVGIFTERDILVRVVAARRDSEQTKVREVMSTPVAVAGLQSSLDELREVMREKRIRHIPIVENDQLIGIVSIGDLNLIERQKQAETIRYLEQYMYKP